MLQTELRLEPRPSVRLSSLYSSCLPNCLSVRIFLSFLTEGWWAGLDRNYVIVFSLAIKDTAKGLTTILFYSLEMFYTHTSKDVCVNMYAFYCKQPCDSKGTSTYRAL